MTDKKNRTRVTKQQNMTEQEYLQFCGVNISDDFKIIKEKLLWKTMGKNRKTPPYWVKLKDCDINHLKNIIINVKYLHPITKQVILSLLQDRWCREQKNIDKKYDERLREKINQWRKRGYSLDVIDKIINHIQLEQQSSNSPQPISINITDNGIRINDSVITRSNIRDKKDREK